MLAVAGEARAQQAFRCPAPGTVIEFTSGGKITFGDQDGFWCQGTGTKGQPWRWFAMMAGGGSRDAPYIENHVERIWPLEVGKEIEFRYPGSNDQVAGGGAPPYVFWYIVKVTVVRHEPVTVPAGTFDAWLIEIHTTTSARLNGTFIRSYWYAPEVGYNVKSTWHVAQGIGKDSAYEATAIYTAPPATVAAPPPAPSVGAVPSAGPVPPSSADRLRELKGLLDRKLITPGEYEAKRKAILDQL